MSDTSKILSNFLSIWEDMCSVVEAVFLRDGLQPVSQLKNVRKFRRELLKCAKGVEIEPSTYYVNVGESNYGKQFSGFLSNVKVWPFIFLEWVTSSRRVFRLSTEMQNAFEHISVSDVPISDILLPFNSFVIELAYPVVWDGDHFSHVVVSNPFRHTPDLAGELGVEDIEPILAIHLLSNKLKNYQPLTLEDITKLEKASNNNNTGRIQKFLTQKGEKKLKQWPKYRVCMVVINKESPFNAAEYPDLFGRDGVIMKILLNLCLYLDALPDVDSQEVTDTKWSKTKTEGLRHPEVVTDELHLCNISGYHVLQAMSDNSGERGDNERGQVSPHWRRGYRRRKAGEGNNPDAPRSIRVKPTLVRADLIPEIGLPKASTSSVR